MLVLLSIPIQSHSVLNIVLNNVSLYVTVMSGGDFDGPFDYLEQFGSNNVSVTVEWSFKKAFTDLAL